MSGKSTTSTAAEAVVPELLTTGEVARLLSCGERTVWRWSRSGAMPTPLKLNPGRQGAVRFRRADIMAWIEAGCPRVGGR